MLFLSTIEKQTKKALASFLVLALSCSGWLGSPAFAQAAAAIAPAAVQGPAPAWASPRGNAHRLLQLAQGRDLSIEDEKLIRAIALRFPEAARTPDTDSLFEQSQTGLRLAQSGKEFLLRLLSALGDAAEDPASLGMSPEAFAELADLRGSLSRTPSLDAARNAAQSSDFGGFFDGSGPSASGAIPVAAQAWVGTAVPSSAMTADQNAALRGPASNAGLPAPARYSFPSEKPGLWQRIKAFFRGPALVPAVFIGSISSTYGSEISGASTFLHEGSHRAAAQLLADPGYLKLQVDGFENFGELVKNPSWDNLKDFLSMRDTHADGAAGYVSYGDLHPTELGRRIGANASRAVISAAGSAAQAGASMAQFAVGYAVRKDHPVIGYTLMAASSVQHLSNSLYLWSAAGMSAGELAEAATTGHDWASFAAATGINPTLTALAYTALLPAEALVLHLIGKAVQKKKDDQRALASLISRGEITEADLLRLYDGYPEKARLQAAERSVAALASGQGSPADSKASGEAQRQYRAFQLHVVQAYRDRIEGEKALLGPLPEEKLSLKERLAAGWKGLFSGPDKTGNLLQAGMLGGGVAAGAAALAKTLGSALGGEILKGLVPGLGVLGAAYGLHKIGKALGDRSSDGVVKTLDILQNALSVAGAAGMATLNPLLAAGGHGASLAVLIAKLVYLKYHPA